MKEGIDMGIEPEDGEKPLQGRNQWPQLAGWQKTMQLYFEEVRKLAMDLLRAFALV